MQLLLLPAGLILSSWLLARPLRRFNLTPDDPIFAFLLACVTYSLVSLLLVRFGLFSVPTAVSVLVLGSLAARLANDRSEPSGQKIPNAPKSGGRSKRIRLITIALIAAVGLIYVLFPTYYLFGGRDPGVYLLQAAHFAQTGGDIFLVPVERTAYPAFYYGSDPFRPIAQFMHLFPATCASFFSMLGIEGGVRANGFLAILALLSFYSLLRQLLPGRIAIITTFCLAINPAFLFVARGTYSEIFAVLLFSLGAAVLTHATRTNRTGSAFLAGAIMGCMCLNRIDGTLAMLSGIGLAGAVIVQYPSRIRLLAGFSLGFLLLGSIGFLDAYVNSPFYLADLLKQTRLPIVLAACGSALLVILIAPAVPGITRLRNQTRLIGFVRILLVVVSVGWFLYAFFVRPLPPDPSAPREAARAISMSRSMIELGWYTTIPCIILFLYGLGALLGSGSWPRWAPLISIAIPSFLIFTYDPTILPDHPWASRRWVPYLIPTLFAIAGYGGYRISRYRGPLLAWGPKATVWALLIFYLTNAIHINRSFLDVALLRGWHEGYEAWTQTVETRDPQLYYHRDRGVASILTFVYGVETLPFLNHTSTETTLSPVPGLGPVSGLYPEPGINEFPDSLRKWTIRDPLHAEIARETLIGFGEAVPVSDPELARHHLGRGWTKTSNGGAWSIARKTNFLFSLPPMESERLLLEIRYNPYRPSLPASVTCVAKLNGHVLGQVPLDVPEKNAVVRFDLPVDQISYTEPNQVEFAFRGLVTPAMRKLSSDRRLLGFRLQEFTVIKDPYLVKEDQVIDFSPAGKSDLYVLDGFLGKESWGRWIDGHRGRLALLFSEFEPSKTVKLEVFHRTYRTSLNDPLLIKARIGPDVVGEWSITAGRNPKTLEILIPPALRSDAAPSVLRFEVENPISPSEARSSSDTRILGLGIFKIAITTDRSSG